MNEILPRVSPIAGQRRNIVAVKPLGGDFLQNRSGHSVLPRAGAGISAKTVLREAGVVRGRLVRVTPHEGLQIHSKQEKKVAEKPKPEVKVIVKPAAKVEWVQAAPMTEKEERLADLLEAAQDMKPKVDEVAEEQAGATEPYDDLEFMREQSAESASGPETAEKKAEMNSGKGTRKKRRGRKGKRSEQSSQETERAE